MLTPTTAVPAHRRLAREPSDLVLACRALTRIAERSGYGDLLASVNPIRFADPKVLAHARGGLHSRTATLAEVFYFGASVPRGELEGVIGRDVVDALLTGGIVRTRGSERVASSGLVLTQTLGLWYFHETPTANPTLYFGEDSVALALRQPRVAEGRALDVCCGPGVQLLQAVRHGATGVGIEINRFAATMARINAGMNGLADRVDIRVGSLFDRVASRERFDLIVSNPPFLPCPSDVAYAFIGDGGDDGMELTWSILDGVAEHLSASGVAQIVGATFSDGVTLCIERRLEALARDAELDVLLTVTSAFELTEGSPMLDVCVGIGTDPAGHAHARTRFLELIAEQGATHLCGYFIHVRRGRGRMRVLDIAPQRPSGMFFV